MGFAAAVAVSDEPRISSLTGAVSWSRSAARDLVRRIPAVAAELAARSGHLPVLRLPFAADGAPPEGFATAVTLPLRDEAADLLIRRLLAEAGPALLLALPALATIEIEVDGTTRALTAAHDGDGVTITVDGAAGRWRTAAAGGRADPGLLAGRPAEERARPSWSVRWAVPVTLGGENGDAPAGRLPEGVSAVVHAPTPTDEPLGLPALLLASFPLSPDRRHVAPGPLTDFLLDQAAEVYARPAAQPRARSRPARSGPGPGGAGRAGRAAAPRDPGAAAGDRVPARRRAPARGSGRATRSSWTPTCPASPTASRRCCTAWSRGRPGIPPTWYSASGGCGWPSLPTCSPRSTATRPGGGGCTRRWPPQSRASWRARRAAGAARRRAAGAGPARAAAARAGPRASRAAGATRPARGASRRGAPAACPAGRSRGDTAGRPRRPGRARSGRGVLRRGGSRPVADAVLSLVAAAHLRPGEQPWLADLALPGTDGEWYPAGEMLLPGGPLAEVVAADTPFGTAQPGDTQALRRRDPRGSRRAVVIRPAGRGGRRP